uniref:Uncharacterized protein n=1 Tax=uncultured marine microorganism HF4000_010I05 TaxID=455517 RepID=B3T1I7_9ZZZZ|nr:hypothetical protein ALOHA_HF4000010I05ctg1g10 [uncultured marine microorganism HF4000_010I05]
MAHGVSPLSFGLHLQASHPNQLQPGFSQALATLFLRNVLHELPKPSSGGSFGWRNSSLDAANRPVFPGTPNLKLGSPFYSKCSLSPHLPSQFLGSPTCLG